MAERAPGSATSKLREAAARRRLVLAAALPLASIALFGALGDAPGGPRAALGRLSDPGGVDERAYLWFITPSYAASALLAILLAALGLEALLGARPAPAPRRDRRRAPRTAAWLLIAATALFELLGLARVLLHTPRDFPVALSSALVPAALFTAFLCHRSARASRGWHAWTRLLLAHTALFFPVLTAQLARFGAWTYRGDPLETAAILAHLGALVALASLAISAARRPRIIIAWLALTATSITAAAAPRLYRVDTVLRAHRCSSPPCGRGQPVCSTVTGYTTLWNAGAFPKADCPPPDPTPTLRHNLAAGGAIALALLITALAIGMLARRGARLTRALRSRRRA